MSNLLYGLIALIAFILAAYLFLREKGAAGGSSYSLILAIILIIAGIIFGGLFLAGRVNKKDDIHITE